MADNGNWGMKFHQTVSFSGAFLRIPKAEAVFWPGCALMNLDGRILDKTLAVLRRAETNIQLATGCCGQPTEYLFPANKAKREDSLVDQLRKQGVRRIYTACPNCTVQLRKLGVFEIIPIWSVLAEYLTAADIEMSGRKYVWHDPCPTKTDPAQQSGARKLLEFSGCDCVEPEHTREKTICCGNLHMMEFSAPEKSARMRSRRLAELPEDRIVLSNCEGCLNTFRASGRDTCHLLEMLFGKSKNRGWGNRIQTTMKAPIR